MAVNRLPEDHQNQLPTGSSSFTLKQHLTGCIIMPSGPLRGMPATEQLPTQQPCIKHSEWGLDEQGPP